MFAYTTLTADSFVFEAVDPAAVRAAAQDAILEALHAAREAGRITEIKDAEGLAADLADRTAEWLPELDGADDTLSAAVFEGMTREFA